MEDPGLWQIIDRVMQWLILPGLAGVAHLLYRQNQQDKEILRLATIMEERNARRDDDRAQLLSAIANLQAAINAVDAKLEAFKDYQNQHNYEHNHRT